MRRSWMLILPALLLILGVRTCWGPSGQKFSSEVPLAQVVPETPITRFLALTRAAADAEASERRAIEAAGTDAERLRLLRDQEARRQRDAERLLEFADRTAPDPVTVDALVWVLERSPAAALRAEAARRLIRDHRTSERMAGVPQRLLESGQDEAVEVLEALAREHPRPDVRGHAKYAIAAVLKDRAGRTWDDPSSARVLVDQSEELLEEVVADYGDLRIGPGVLADRARADLKELRTLRPGSVAPEIEGRDLQGRPLRLSDYRGRVVVLSFWGFW